MVEGHAGVHADAELASRAAAKTVKPRQFIGLSPIGRSVSCNFSNQSSTDCLTCSEPNITVTARASSNCDGDRVRPVVCAEFVDQVFDVEVDGCLSNPESIGNLLVAMAVAYQPEYVQFTSREVILTKMLR